MSSPESSQESSGADSAPSSGSCYRCKRSLDAAAAKVGDHWYGNAECARGEGCPLDTDRPVPKEDLWVMPRRYLDKRRPIELQTSASSEAAASKPSALPFKKQGHRGRV